MAKVGRPPGPPKRMMAFEASLEVHREIRRAAKALKLPIRHLVEEALIEWLDRYRKPN